MLSFLKAFVKDRKNIGSIISSSKSLSKSIAELSELHTQYNGKLLELGAGTGSVSVKIIDFIRNVELVEINQEFIKILNKKFSHLDRVKITNLNFMDIKCDNKYDTIVCCLPLSNFSQEFNDKITNKVLLLLNDNGTVIFFEYIGLSFIKRIKKFNNEDLKEIYSEKIYNNFPPARVRVLKKQ